MKVRPRHILVLVMTLLFLVAFCLSLKKLLSGETIRMTSIDEDSKMIPSVTLCLSNRDKMDNKTLMKQLEELPTQAQLIVAFEGRFRRTRSSRTSMPTITEHFHVEPRSDRLVLSRCFTGDFPESRERFRERKRISLDYHFAQGHHIMMYIHEPGGFFFTELNILGRTSAAIPMALEETKVFMYSMVFNIDRSRENQPCDIDNRQRTMDCLWRWMVDQIRCRMPWLNSEDYPEDLRVCDSEADFQNYARVLIENYRSTMGGLLREAGCSRNCRMAHFHLQEDHANLRSQNRTRFQILTEDEETIVETEVLAYVETDFIADLGGCLGLLLGASVLSIYDDVLRLQRYLYSRLGKRQQRRRKKESKVQCT